MKLADLGRREMAVIYILGFMLSAALLYKFVVSPELERYRTGRSQFGSQQQREMRTVNRKRVLVEEYLGLRAKADKMQRLLLNKVEADDFQENLPKLSERTGNDLTSITPMDSEALVPEDPRRSRNKVSAEEAKQAAELSEIEQMPVVVTIEGKYANIIKLFNTLEGFEELMVVSDVGVTSVRDSTTEVETRFSLNLIHTRTEMKSPADGILAEVSAMDQVAAGGEPNASGTSSGSAASGGRTAAAGKNIRYAVQIGAFNIAENSKALSSLLKSKNYEPWVRTNSATGQAPHHVLVGKFATKAAADQFGQLMKKELPWVDDYIVKQTVLDLDTVLREARTEE